MGREYLEGICASARAAEGCDRRPAGRELDAAGLARVDARRAAASPGTGERAGVWGSVLCCAAVGLGLPPGSRSQVGPRRAQPAPARRLRSARGPGDAGRGPPPPHPARAVHLRVTPTRLFLSLWDVGIVSLRRLTLREG